MAKTKNKSSNPIKNPKPKTSIFLCCFGSPEITAAKGSDKSVPTGKQKRKSGDWFSRIIRIRVQKNVASKTVPLEAHYSKARSKSTVLHKSLAPAPSNNPLPPLTQTLPVHPATPYYTPSLTRHSPSNGEEDTRQPGRRSPNEARSKRQPRRRSSWSSTQQQPQTTANKRNARASSSYDPVVGMSVVVVTLVIMVFWGRICAILCTSAWLYYIPRFRNTGEVNDETGGAADSGGGKEQNDVPDLDSGEYKKRVIMEGLLERNNNHR